MSLFLKNHNIERWEDAGTNNDQNYLTHSLFRYFGKLPPVLTSRILKEFVIPEGNKKPIVLDLMCGSGTTLVEAQRFGMRSIGVDSNDISILISKVKTSELNKDAVIKALKQFQKEFEIYSNNLGYDGSNNNRILERWPRATEYIPNFRNIDKWFTKKNQIDLAVCRNWIEQWKKNTNLYEFLFVCWLGIIRLCSNASVRPGRIFHDRQKIAPNVFNCFLHKFKENLSLFDQIPKEHFASNAKIFLGDARNVKLPLPEKADFTFFHPPYFALYKYSSDVLRFELEWGQFSRKEILHREIEDGFKTTDSNLMYPYVNDLIQAITNGFRHTKTNCNVAIVVGNSTLSEKQLPIIEFLLERCENMGIKCVRIIERPIQYSQAVYHKSANPNIRSKSDYILVFSKN